jgi:hypothetical protein
MVDFKCDTCTNRNRDSDGRYTRCRYMGDTKKRIDCEKYNDERIVKNKLIKRDMLSWCD